MTTTDGRTRAGGEHPGPADPSGPDDTPGRSADPTGGQVAPAARAREPDGGPAVARVRARRALPASADAPGRPGRHALPEDAPASGHTPPPGYRPRHAAPDRFAAEPGAAAEPAPAAPEPAAPAAAAPEPAVPEPAAGPPTPPAPDPDAIAPTPVRGLPLASTFPASAVTASEDVPRLEGRPAVYGWRSDDDAAGAATGGPPPERVRVVLSERRSPTRAVGTVAEIEAQTATGELLLSNLMRSQLTLALRLAAVAVLVLGVLPIVFLTMPTVSEAVPVLGIGLPWLLLGVLAFPFLLVLGWLYTRHAERNERDFTDDVED